MNQSALDFIRQREGCRLNAYLDTGGVPTVGYGATGPNIRLGTVWTQEQADSDLADRVSRVETLVSMKTVSVRLSQRQAAALISFSYNIGMYAFSTSHVLAFLLMRNWIATVKAMLDWDHVNGIEVQGLLKRRLEEGALFLDGTP